MGLSRGRAAAGSGISRGEASGSPAGVTVLFFAGCSWEKRSNCFCSVFIPLLPSASPGFFLKIQPVRQFLDGAVKPPKLFESLLVLPVESSIVPCKKPVPLHRLGPSNLGFESFLALIRKVLPFQAGDPRLSVLKLGLDFPQPFLESGNFDFKPSGLG